jgi:hypothetical protein
MFVHALKSQKLESLLDLVEGKGGFEQRVKRAVFHDTAMTHRQ